MTKQTKIEQAVRALCAEQQWEIDEDYHFICITYGDQQRNIWIRDEFDDSRIPQREVTQQWHDAMLELSIYTNN